MDAPNPISPGPSAQPAPGQASASVQNSALQAEPLPDYTKSWGPNLHRPLKLPEQYDTRIDPRHIFVFTVHPITGIERDFYVTPKPCDYCAKVRQICSRTRPFCARCGAHTEKARSCAMEEGWVRLPGPKCAKPKRNREADDDGGRKKVKKVKPFVAKQNKLPSKSEAAPSAMPSQGSQVTAAASQQLHSEASSSSKQDSQPDVIETATREPSPPRVSGRYGLRPHIKRTTKVS